MAFQSASDLARKLYADFQQKAVPTVKSAVGQFIQRGMITPQSSIHSTTPNALGQKIFNAVGNFNPATAIPFAPPAVKQIIKPYIPTVGQYVQGQIINPIRQGVQTAINPKQNLPNRVIGGAQVLGGAFSATPAGLGFNTLSGGIAGGLNTLRNGGNLQQNIRQSIAQPTSIAQQGLGIQNPLLAAGVDLVASRNPKAALKDIKNLGATVKGLNGYSPRAFDIHPADQEVMADFVNAIQTGGAKKALGQLGTDAQRIAEHYIGKKAVGITNEKLAQVFDALLSSQARARGEDAIQTAFPKMGFVGKSSLTDSKGQTKIGAIDTTQQAISGISPRLLGKTANDVGGNLPKSTTPLNGSIANFNADEYIKDLTKKQKSAGEGGPKGFIQKGKNLLSEIKTKLVDSTSPIEDALSAAEKKGKFQVRPSQDVRLQIDKVLRAKSLGAQFAKDNGFEDVIKNAPDLNALDQYMIAKQASRVTELGKQTGRDSAKDQQLIATLAPQYEQLAQQVNQYSRKLLDYSVDAGLVDKNVATELVKKYPDYVPLQRVFNEVERGAPYKGSTKAVASLSKQTVVQKLEGSEREIASPIESLLLKTQTAFEQGEKNKAGKMLASYKDLPGFKGLVREIPSGQSAPHTISFLDNGVKKTFETTPEIASAAKNLNQEQMNIVLKVLSIPTRVLQLGATGLNIPFVVTNIAKDQVTAFINSNKAAKTSLLNPLNFGRALFSAVKHDKLYDEVVREGGMQTSFDISRSQPNLSVAKIRSGKNLKSKIAYTATHPQELLRGLENIVGRAEEVTRIQQYRGAYQAFKKTHNPQEARILAAKAARENTANFARKGDIGKVVNYIIPFFNAGIQGARVFVRNVQTRPLETGAKVAVGVFMPVAATTAWNMSDPQRKAVYEDIDEFEKQNNLILIPDGATKDEKGRWNVIKIPLPPGLSNLGTLVRRPMEQAAGLDPIKFSEIANNLITAGTSIDVSSTNKIASTFTPQAVKPFVEGYTNTNLFTGNKIVPDSLKDLPITEQSKPYTSGTARIAGKILNQSPLKVENFIKTAGGGVGSQLLNASDTLLNKVGAIPDEQVGGEDAGSALARRFSKASGGAIDEKGALEVQGIKEQSALDRNRRKYTAEKLYTELKQLPPDQAFEQYKTLKEQDPLLFKTLNTHIENEKLGLTYREKVIKDLTVEDYARSKFIAKEFKELKTNEEKAALWDEWVRKKIITKDVVRQLNAMKQRGEL